MPGTLILCATPIGNLGDVSDRAAETLRTADVVFAEDTRRTAKLLRHLGSSVGMRSFFAHNQAGRLGEMREHFDQGHTVVVVSDAGTPVISDPGQGAVAAAIEAGASVSAIPGPSAVVTALSVSGFDGDRFVFDGFLPRKGGARSTALGSIGAESRTVVIFASPKRLARDLADLAEHTAGERQIVIAREMTKLHEEIWRGSLTDAVSAFDGEDVRGEITVVLEGVPPREPNLEEAVTAVAERTDSGESVSAAVRTVATETGVSRRALYERVTHGTSA